MKRLEVWFNNGLFRAFPKVTEMRFIDEGKTIEITFGDGKHKTRINYNNINFYELMEE